MYRPVEQFSKEPDRPAIWSTGAQHAPFDRRNWARVSLLLARRAAASGLVQAAGRAERAGLWLDTHPAPRAHWLRRLGPFAPLVPARQDLGRTLWHLAAWPRAAAGLVDRPPAPTLPLTVVDFGQKAARMRRRGARRPDPEARKLIRRVGRKGKGASPQAEAPTAFAGHAALPEGFADPVPAADAAAPADAAPAAAAPAAPPGTPSAPPPDVDREPWPATPEVELHELAAIRAALAAGEAAAAPAPAPAPPPPRQVSAPPPLPRLFETPPDEAPPRPGPLEPLSLSPALPPKAQGLAWRLASGCLSGAARLSGWALRALGKRLRGPLAWVAIRMLAAAAVALALPWGAARALVLHLDHVDLSEYD